MLTRIIHQSPQLVTFFEDPKLPLIEPQKWHLINMADGIPVTEGRKTLANIQRQEESLSEEHCRGLAGSGLPDGHPVGGGRAGARPFPPLIAIPHPALSLVEKASTVRLSPSITVAVFEADAYI